MPADNMRRRVLLAAGPSAAGPIRQLFLHGPLDSWEAVEADSFAQVRFIAKHNPCDLALVHEDLLHREGEPALAWIAQNHDIPVVFLTSYHAETITRAYRQGVTVCLPRDLSLAHPWLLDAALERAAAVGEENRGRRRNFEQLLQCRRHIDRLVNLIWRASPMEPNTHWFTQRHTMERLQEEISRTERHGTPLTLAVAEVRVEDQEEVIEAAGAEEVDVIKMDEWTSQIVSQGKRRCDVAGQYGMQGFLLLMVHTPKEGGVICCKRLKELLEKSAGDAGIGAQGPIRAYFGLASSSADTASAQSLLHYAEQNLEAAKAGREEGVVAG